MRKFSLLLYVVSLSISLVSPSVINAQPIDTTHSELRAEDIKFREKFGLDSSVERINEARKQGSSSRYGVSLTREEEQDLENRFEEQRKIKEAVRMKVEDASLAWLYIDQTSGGTIHVGIKNQSEEFQKSSLESLSSSRNKVVVETASYTDEELRIWVDKIASSRFSYDGFVIHHVSTNIPDEKVDVTINPYTDEHAELLQRIFPIPMNITEAEIAVFEARDDEVRPLVGGLEISVGPCTGAFSARNSSNNYYYITAGHCTDVNDVVEQGGQFIGITDGSNVGGSNDSATISIPSSLSSKYVYTTIAQGQLLSSVQDSSNDSVGDPVCKSGAATDVTCGEITDTYVNDYIGSAVFDGVKAADYSSTGGDSGAVVYHGSTLIGVNFGRLGSTAYYSPADVILDYWNLIF